LDNFKYTYEFIPLRGISKETLARYDVKTKVDPDGKPVAIGFKYPNGATKVRSLDQKSFHWANGSGNDGSNITPAPGLFGTDRFTAGSHKYVTITEGELDALSLYQASGTPVVSVQSASSAVRDCIAERAWLNSFERVYLAFDNDLPGKDATRSVAKLFDYNKLYQVKFDKRKDANEFLQNGEQDTLKQLFWNAKRYQPEEIVSHFEEFEKILAEQPKPGVPYPFPALNEMTYGIRTGESVLLTAQEGVGKTELMHAIEYQLLKETDNVPIGAIFLEEPKRRHLQAIAGLHLRRPVHLPDCFCKDGEISTALREAVGMDERLHVYSHFGSDDPDGLLDTIRFLVSARSCRYILFDHISMAVSGLAGEDERRALDYLSTRLEMMVKELDFGLIMVSHVNDDGKTRGSRYISKIADIRIDARRDTEHPDKVERNTTTLTISKNRFSGKTGLACRLIFDPETYTYSEVENDVWKPSNDNSAEVQEIDDTSRAA
jgi:twinkle protein